MAVADLNEVQARMGALVSFLAVLRRREKTRLRNSSGRDCPHNSGAGPGHALEESSAVDAVFLIVVIKNVLIVGPALGSHEFPLFIESLARMQWNCVGRLF